MSAVSALIVESMVGISIISAVLGFLLFYMTMRKLKIANARISLLEGELNNAIVLKKVFELSNYEMEPATVLKGVLEILVEHFGASDGSIFLTDGEQLVPKATTIKLPIENVRRIPRYPEFSIEVEDQVPKILVGRGVFNYPTAIERGIRYAFYVPFLEGEHTIGALLLESTDPDKMVADTESRFYQLVTDSIRKTMDKSLQFEDVFSRANYDKLTGALKREALTMKIEELCKTSKSMAVVMLDLDNFKRVNDSLGHDAGDTVLKGVSQLLSDTLRKGDLVSRWGGDEFVLILRDADIEAAPQIVERLRIKIEDQVINYGSNKIPYVTASLGLACWLPGMAFEDVLKQADDNAYISKREGRNMLTA